VGKKKKIHIVVSGYCKECAGIGEVRTLFGKVRKCKKCNGTGSAR